MRRALPALLLASSCFLASTAHAAEDCPPGSVSTTEDGFSWCRPTVCSNEVPCRANEVCRPVPLCLQVGTIADAATADGGQRLVVTQRCVAGREPGDPKTCPQKQTCSEMSRCISNADAEKLGLLDAPKPATTPSETKKSSCGCDVIGASTGQAPALVVAALGAAMLRRRRRS